MLIFRQTSEIVSPLARSRSISRSSRATSSAVRRFFMGPSLAHSTEGLPFQVDQFLGSRSPGFRTISDFRKTHLDRLEALFVEALKLCALAGLARVGTIALDGTKIKANASRHKAMSYDRMPQEEARLKQEIATILAEAESADEA